jgi:selenide,water dikinase
MQQDTPAVRDLVLVGGGHSHVQVLKSFAMQPLPGTRLTIISREVHTPYSGMLPGHVAGVYSWRDIHIDLGPLAGFAGARLIADEVVGLDTQTQRLRLLAHPDLYYDVLSINAGAVPTGTGQGIPVKPIGRFLPQLQRVQAEARSGERVALIGGGAGGVELALALRRTLRTDVAVSLLTVELLPDHPPGVVRRLHRALHDAGVELVSGFRALSNEQGTVCAEDGRQIAADHVFWVTGVSAPDWPAEAGLATDSGGFIEVDRCLRSTSHPQIYAAGDIAALVDQPRAKSGVFAVREGPVLSRNLRRCLLERPPLPFRAQKRFLSLIGTGDGRAVASKGRFVAEGRWVWRWKDWIDRRFMARFNDLPEMPAAQWQLPANMQADAPEQMRCGGCGAKLGANPLQRVLGRLPPQNFGHVAVGIGDDAAVIRSTGGDIVLTIDGFRSLVSDPYLFGRITAHHALNDVLAMGATGTAALALATVPLMSENLMEEDLFQLMRGAVDVLNAHGVALVGGHSAEGAELSLGLTVTGSLDNAPLTKSGLQSGNRLLLTKPLGTGAIMAGHMRGKVPSDLLRPALDSMDTSNADALDVLREHDVTAATDVSGFGLLGHLGEMLRASGLGVEVSLGRVPMFPGALMVMQDGVASSLQTNNEMALQDFSLVACEPTDPRVRVLVDPQTSGGLLASVPAERAEDCLQALQAIGYGQAAIIGEVVREAWKVKGD